MKSGEQRNCGDDQPEGDQIKPTDKSGGGQAEQWKYESYSPDMTIKALFNAKSGVRERGYIQIERDGHDIRDGRAEQRAETEKDNQAEQRSNCQDDKTMQDTGSSIITSGTFTDGSSSKSQTITRCHTIQWPVARYVKLHNKQSEVEKLTTILHPGNKLPGGDQTELCQAEHQQRAESTEDARDQAEQDRDGLTREDQAEPRSSQPEARNTSGDPDTQPITRCHTRNGLWRGM